MSIRRVQDQLGEWVRSVLGPVQISEQGPGSDSAAEVVLYPMSLSSRQEARDARGRQPRRFGVRYLITTQGEQAIERLQELVVSALAVPDWDVDLDGLGPDAWSAFGTAPRPAFVVEAEVAVARVEPAVSLVLEPLVLDVTDSRRLSGRVVGPGSVPIPDARVELVGLGRHAYTDGDGRFGFASAPQEDSQARFRVSAKGRELVATVELTTDDEPVVIRCEQLGE